MAVPSYKRVLQSGVSPDDASWHYTLRDLPPSSMGAAMKLISVTSTDITLSFTKKPVNRALDFDATDKFILVAFASLRFSDLPIRKASDYIQRLLTVGIDLNGTTYRFYGHSNSQLRSRTCFLYAGTASEISDRINSLGDFSKFMSTAKRAKRIGLLFSAAEMGYPLSSSECEDIPDVEANGHVFTDGCGFISRRFARTLSRHRGIVFRNEKYIPSVFQIRYKGYKGIVTLNPSLNRQRGPKTRRHRHPLVQFRDSMRKFKGCKDDTFSVVDYSKPYMFGKLNGELVTLLSCLGIPDEVFLQKQEEYFRFTKAATRDPLVGLQFASYCNQPDLGEKLALEGLEPVRSELRKLQSREWTGHFDKRDEERVRIMIRESRLLFGVSDPGNNLAEDECQVRITVEGGGIRTLDGAEVIVARNPCLHPGDIRKLRAVRIPNVLDHLVDCIVFSVQGERPAASLMSGGDLDGDKFFVSWDKDLIPSKLYEAYEYPPAKEVPRRNISHEDMIRYFAHYNSASLGRVKNCYLEWVRIKGADSQECRDLNALFSSCVDGERMKIPEHLQSIPEKLKVDRGPFILDNLCDAVKAAACHMFLEEPQLVRDTTSLDMLDLLVSWPTICLSEFELFQLVHRWAFVHGVPLTRFLWHFDFGAFTAVQKQWIAARMPDTLNLQCLLYNGLNQSTLIRHTELEAYNLHWPSLHWKRIYSSYEHDFQRFFHFVETALEQFRSKLIIIRVDDRLTVAMYIPMRVAHNEDNVVDDVVRVLGFTPTGVDRRHHSTTVPGYRLYFDEDTFQLFQGTRGNTFVFITTAGADTSSSSSSPVVRTSIALEKINRSIQRHVGFVKKTPIMAAEIYVISNRDRLGHEILNIAMNQVDTQGGLIPLVQNIAREYELSDMTTVTWNDLPRHCASIIRDRNLNELELLQDMADFELIFETCIQHNGHGELSLIVEYILNHPLICSRNSDIVPRILAHLEDVPMLVIPVLNAFLSREEIGHSAVRFPDTYAERSLHLYLLHILLLTTNNSHNLVLPEVDRLLKRAPPNSISLSGLSELVMLIPMSTRRPELVWELLHTLVTDHSPRLLSDSGVSGVAMDYFNRNALAIALDRAGEAAELCPCDDWGVPTGSSKVMITLRRSQQDRRVFEAELRLDAPSSMRNGDHIRLKVATAPTNKPFRRCAVLDASVEGAEVGVLKLKLIQPAPPEVDKCSWEVFSCGSMVTTKVMMDSLTRLLVEGDECCGVYGAILLLDERKDGTHVTDDNIEPETAPAGRKDYENEKMNESQKSAVVAAMEEQLTLVWGPPGTGKTTVVVEILMQLRSRFPDEKLLITASTHNAVDNVLERFLAARSKRGLGDSDEIVRIATDCSKVAQSLRRHTLDAFVGSNNLHSDYKAKREAEKRVKKAMVVFTTCTGAGLGILRDVKFDTAVIDEASQLAEANALAPLVKGPRRVILVGDHVQLRPTVRPQAEVYQLDTSLFERLYGAPPRADTRKVMLNVQYRMHPLVSAFPSREFYNGRLLDGVRAEDRKILPSSFPWPVHSTDSSEFDRVILVRCSTRESIGLSSKKNDGQVKTCVNIVKMLLDRPDRVKGKAAAAAEQTHQIAILTPYKRQFDELKRNLPSELRVEVSTVDAFQGREADIIIFSTVRCNGHGDLGFVTDPRRMNVTLTRAKLGTIIVGDEATLTARGGLWQKLVADVQKVDLT